MEFKNIKLYDNVVYEPSVTDFENINKIISFLNEREIPFVKDEKVFGVFHLNDGQLQLRYVNSYYHRMDMSKRCGELQKGIHKDYFINISHDNVNKGIRTIWIFDFEMKQTNEITDKEGNVISYYHRQWEVLKNYICTATGHIDNRIFARECEVKEITDNKLLRNFLNTNCFYAYRSASVNLGVYAKKDKGGIKKGDLLMVYTFGHNYYGNKNRMDNPFIEIIRVSTKIGCQVIGGASKCLKYFLKKYDTLKMGDHEVKVNELKFYTDASHNNGIAMSNLGFNFEEWKGAGFMNIFTEDVDEVYIRPDGKKVTIKGKQGEIQQRKPAAHKRIMELMSEGKIISVANAGTIVFTTNKEDYLQINK